jgi:hypothetical protein
MNLEKRIEQLERAIERATAPEHEHVFFLNVITSREQALASEERRSRSEKPCPLCAAGSRPRVVVLTSTEVFNQSQFKNAKGSSNGEIT